MKLSSGGFKQNPQPQLKENFWDDGVKSSFPTQLLPHPQNEYSALNDYRLAQGPSSKLPRMFKKKKSFQGGKVKNSQSSAWLGSLLRP